MIIIIEYKLISFPFGGQGRRGEGLPSRVRIVSYRSSANASAWRHAACLPAVAAEGKRTGREDRDAALREPVGDSSLRHFLMTRAISRRSAGGGGRQCRADGIFTALSLFSAEPATKNPACAGFSYSSVDSRSDVCGRSVWCPGEDSNLHGFTR